MDNPLAIDSTLRLVPYKGKYEFALNWYQDRETLKLVDGEKATLHHFQ